jgi:adenine/guanine phosphoribosyltransferase-like PRPP-binding protein
MKIKSVLSIVLYSFLTFCSLGAEKKQDIIENTPPKTYAFKFGAFSKEYAVVPPAGNDKVRIVYIPDFSDNIRMGDEAAASLVQMLKGQNLLQTIEAVIVPGDKANMLATKLHGKISSIREASGFGSTSFAILRSAEKGAVESSIGYASITGGDKTLKIRPDQVENIKGKRVLLFDDVLSTGGTLKAVRELIQPYGCEVVAYACVATEDVKREDFEGKQLFSLAHLPVWFTKG